MFLNNFICQLDSAINKLLSITLEIDIIQNWGIGYLFTLHGEQTNNAYQLVSKLLKKYMTHFCQRINIKLCLQISMSASSIIWKYKLTYGIPFLSGYRQLKHKQYTYMYTRHVHQTIGLLLDRALMGSTNVSYKTVCFCTIKIGCYARHDDGRVI